MKFHRPPTASLSFQALFWVLHLAGTIYLFHTILSPGNQTGWTALIIFECIQIAAVNLHLYFFIPNFLRRRRWGTYAVGVLAMAIVFSFLKDGIAEIFLYFDPDFFGEFHRQRPAGFSIFSTLFVMILSLPILLFDYLLQKERLQAQLENQQLQSELQFLRTQINPHFLFNVLNNIYTLIHLHSDQAAPTVLNLSEMMRYMLYETQVKLILLEKEIAFIQRYIAMQIGKQGDHPTVHFQVGPLPPKLTVPPLLLIPLFENAFKYSDWDSETGDGWIRAGLSFTNGQLQFSIENTLASPASRSSSGGIGLENTRQRLQLLYPQHHTFLIQEAPDHFRIDLHLIPATNPIPHEVHPH